MSNNNLRIDLKTRLDKDGQKFFVGKLQFPGNLNCKDGVAFLIFVSEEGAEELQITGIDKNNRDE